MTEINPCNWLQNAGSTHTASQMRLGIGGLIAGGRTSASLTSRGGVNPSVGGALLVTQTGGGGMSVTVASGVVFVPGSESGTSGTYICVNDASVNRTIQSSHGSNDRIDLVVARVRDSFYSGATNAWEISVVTGTAASIPTIPDAPANSLILAQVLVEAATNTIVNDDITDRRTFLSAVGGVVSVSDTTERDALNNAYDGLAVWRRDNHDLEIYNGSSWFSILDQMRDELNAKFPPVAYTLITDNFEDFLSDDYTPTDPACEVTFTAPTSGKTIIEMYALLDADFSGERVIARLTVREDDSSGTIVIGPNPDISLSRYWSTAHPQSESKTLFQVLEDLTPGETYWAQLQFNTLGTTVDITAQQLVAIPLP